MFDETKVLTTFTRSERAMLEQVIRDAEHVLSVSDARQLLEKKTNDVIELANPDLQPIAFALKQTTQADLNHALASDVGGCFLVTLFSPLILLTGPRAYSQLSFLWQDNKRTTTAMRRNSIAELQSNEKPPILFLRSFSSQASHSHIPADLRTAEERLADSYRSYGPLIAVGHPEEDIPMLGPLRLYFDNDTWHAGVLYLMSVSQLVIIQVGISPGTLWELAVAKKFVNPERLMISLADPVLPLMADTKYYLMFKKYLEEIVGWELPNQIGRSMNIRFGKDWEPRFFDKNAELLSFPSIRPKGKTSTSERTRPLD
jgi:hypothetical protein